MRPETNATARIVRNGDIFTLNFVIGKLETEPSSFVPASSNESDYPLGIKVDYLPEGFELVDAGVMVSKVDDSSNSSGKIFEGDVITDIQSGFQRYSISDPESFNEVISKFQSGEKIAIYGLRGNSNFIIPITVD